MHNQSVLNITDSNPEVNMDLTILNKAITISYYINV